MTLKAFDFGTIRGFVGGLFNGEDLAVRDSLSTLENALDGETATQVATVMMKFQEDIEKSSTRWDPKTKRQQLQAMLQKAMQELPEDAKQSDIQALQDGLAMLKELTKQPDDSGPWVLLKAGYGAADMAKENRYHVWLYQEKDSPDTLIKFTYSDLDTTPRKGWTEELMRLKEDEKADSYQVAYKALFHLGRSSRQVVDYVSPTNRNLSRALPMAFAAFCGWHMHRRLVPLFAAATYGGGFLISENAVTSKLQSKNPEWFDWVEGYAETGMQAIGRLRQKPIDDKGTDYLLPLMGVVAVAAFLKAKSEWFQSLWWVTLPTACLGVAPTAHFFGQETIES